MSSASRDIGVEPIVGWRGWFLRLSPSGPELVPAGKGRGAWPIRAPMTARCSARRAHHSPDPSCTCGLYAFKSKTVLRSPKTWFPVIGTVSMWGRIVEHERGWRAEHAYPDRLRLVCGECLRTGVGSGLPVTAGRSFMSPASQVFLSAWCATHIPARLSDDRPASEIGSALLSRYAVDLLPIERIEAMVGPATRRSSQAGLEQVIATKVSFDPPGIVRRLR